MGYYFVFKCGQYQARKEMTTQIRRGIFHPEIKLLKIFHPEKEQQFRRLEKTEVTYFGKLYDVVVERKNGDTTFFYCLHDKKEETLLAGFRLIYHRSGHSGPSNGRPIAAMLYNLVIQALLHGTSQQFSGEATSFSFPVFLAPIFPVYLAHFAPPPETD